MGTFKNLNMLKGLNIFKTSTQGIQVISYRVLSNIVLIEVSLMGKGYRTSNGGINRITGQLLSNIGNWISGELRSLQDIGIKEFRIFPSDEKFISRLRRKAACAKFSLEYTKPSTDGGILSEMRNVHFLHYAGDHYLHFYLPEKTIVTKTIEVSRSEIHGLFKRESI